MAKVVSFSAKETLGKDFKIIDTLENMHLVNQNMRDMFEAIDKYETKQAKDKQPVTVMDYQDIISKYVIKGVASLLGLTKEDAKKLDTMSYSDVFGFYSNVANKFLSMEVPDPTAIRQGIEDMNKAAEEQSKDPKSNADN